MADTVGRTRTAQHRNGTPQQLRDIAYVVRAVRPCGTASLHKYEPREFLWPREAQLILAAAGDRMGRDAEVGLARAHQRHRLIHVMGDEELQRQPLLLSKEAHQLVLVAHGLVLVGEEGRCPREGNDAQRIGEA